MLRPHFEILPPAQRALWPELAEIPRHFVLYGGSALALRLGHRQSEDFDFFSSEDITPSQLLVTLELLKGVKVVQNVSRTLTVISTSFLPRRRRVDKRARRHWAEYSGAPAMSMNRPPGRPGRHSMTRYATGASPITQRCSDSARSITRCLSPRVTATR